MKATLLTLLGAAALGLVLCVPGRVPPAAVAAQDEKKLPPPVPDQPGKDAQPLPDPPKADPASRHVENPQVKGLIIEVLNGKAARVLLATEVCLREGPLEVLLCKKNTKEHEAILRADVDAQRVHEALVFAGATAGRPAQFVDPKTGEAAFKPATGTAVKLSVHYKKDGKLHTHPAQEWVWDFKAKKPLPHDWVFAGSRLLKHPDRPNDPAYYTANSGDIVTIATFPDAMLDLPVEISKDDANLTYEAKTDRIPPLLSKVWLIFEPVPPKK